MSTETPATPPLPIKKQQSVLVLGGLQNKMGHLALLPDQLVFVESSALSAGAGFGALGSLISGLLTASKADQSISAAASRGGKGVTAVRLDDLILIRTPKRNIIEVETKSGGSFKFGGVPYDKWAPVIKLQLEARGSTVVVSASEMRIRS
jgi:hypothetical protein